MKRFMLLFASLIGLIIAVWITAAALIPFMERPQPGSKTPVPAAANDTALKLQELLVRTTLCCNAGMKDLTRLKRFRERDEMLKSLQLSNSTFSPAAPELALFLEREQASFDEIRALLIDSPSPQWLPMTEIQGNARGRGQLDLLAQMQLLKYLTAEALNQHAKGDDVKAWRSVEAQWRLTQSLWRRPELISRLIALAATRIVGGVSRKLPAPAPGWFSEFATLDLEALHRDTWAYESSRADRLQLVSTGDASLHQRAVMYARVPLEYVERRMLKDHYRKLSALKPCADHAAHGKNIGVTVPFWSRSVSTPSLLETRKRFTRVGLEQELSVNVQRVKAAQPRGTAVTLAESRCGAWRLADEKGSKVLRYSGFVPTVKAPMAPAPLEFTF